MQVLNKEDFIKKLKEDNDFNKVWGNKEIDSQLALPPCHLLYQFIVRPLSIEERKHIYTEKYTFNINTLIESNNSIYNDKIHEIMDKERIPRFFLDLNMYQRSVDIALGCPFNITSMSLLLHIFAKTLNMIPGIATWIGGDTHIYMSHIKGIKEQLMRKPKKLPILKINKKLILLEDIEQLKIEDFEINGYDSYPCINYKLSVGL